MTHGGLDERELEVLGIDPATVLDLSANLHPAGISEAVRAAAATARLDRYPPADAGPLRDAIARHEGVPPEWVLPTPGATGAIHLLARALLQSDDRALVVAPAFGEYAAAIKAAGADPVEVRAAPPDFRVPAELPEVRVAFLANPNNPTGTHLSRDAVEELASRLGGTLVLDAAYEVFVRDGWDAVDLVRDGAPVAVVRSMTKLHAMPGVRLGYVLARPEVIDRTGALQPSWSLDALAHAVGPVALAEHEERVALLDAMWGTRERLRGIIEGWGYRVGPSLANFLLLEVGDASAVRTRLLGHQVLARDCASFGLAAWMRLAVPPPAEEERVIEALRDALGAAR